VERRGEEKEKGRRRKGGENEGVESGPPRIWRNDATVGGLGDALSSPVGVWAQPKSNLVHFSFTK